MRGGPHDRGNMLIVSSATGVGLWLPIIFDLLEFGVFKIELFEGVTALVVMVCALALRIWAALSLGKYYTTTLMITEGQKVVSTGPYYRIRHPGYLADILIWSAFGILSSNLFVAIVLPVMFVAVYLYRISSEEKMLANELGDSYKEYQHRTRKLIPFLY